MKLLRFVSDGILYASLGACCALVLVAVGQPIFTDDLWWHLGLGAAYAEQGPWLAGDPLLFSAAAAPAPSSWLADLGLFAWLQAAGFTGLRVLHVGLVTAILALVWTSARRLGGSPRVASVVATVVALLSSYRFFQLRPHLFTILAALLLYRLLLEPGRLPSRGRVLAAAALLGVWASLHAGFVLGPGLLAVSILALLLAAPLRSPAMRGIDRTRAGGLVAALVLGVAATLLSPGGYAAYVASVGAGSDMLSAVAVVDEWRPTHLLSLPVANLPPSPLSWCLLWALVVATALAVPRVLRGWRAEAGDAAGEQVDPVLLGLALTGTAMMILAVRFLWLAVFPLLFLVCLLRTLPPLRFVPPTPIRVVLALVPLLLVQGFLKYGDWPMISKGISGRWQDYAPAYPPAKYHGHAVWLMGDAGLEGRLFARYSEGGFLGYWLAPAIRTATNGSLNMSEEAFRSSLLLRERRGSEEHPDFSALLDAQGFDLFLGLGLPVAGAENRPPTYTTNYLEGAPGWLPIFRNLDSALYLRLNPRNAANLQRIASYYAEQGVPFDPVRGFDLVRVLRESPAWSLRHALVPADFQALKARARPGTGRVPRAAALNRLAGIYLLLGADEQARAADTTLLGLVPARLPALRRQLWLRAQAFPEDDPQEFAVWGERLAAASPGDRIDQELVAVARRVSGGGGLLPHVLPRLSAMRPGEGRALRAGTVSPETRPPRPRSEFRAIPADP
ncbi:MAG: hypothetical protein AAEJ53_17845 [Myxococcota bacterium]